MLLTIAFWTYCKDEARNVLPVYVLQGSNELAIFTVTKEDIGITYKLGTGIVIARRENVSWSAPLAVASFSLRWGHR